MTRWATRPQFYLPCNDTVLFAMGWVFENLALSTQCLELFKFPFLPN